MLCDCIKQLCPKSNSKHVEWLRDNLPCLKHFNLKHFKNEKSTPKSILPQDGLLYYAWPQTYVGETTTAIKDPDVSSLYTETRAYIVAKKEFAKKLNKLDELRELEKIEERYQKFFDRLKKIFLARAIAITLTKLPVGKFKNLKEFYASPQRSLLSVQTQDQCVAEHVNITAIIDKHRKELKKTDVNVNRLTQLEILSKRQISMCYEQPEKKPRLNWY